MTMLVAPWHFMFSNRRLGGHVRWGVLFSSHSSPAWEIMPQDTPASDTHTPHPTRWETPLTQRHRRQHSQSVVSIRVTCLGGSAVSATSEVSVDPRPSTQTLVGPAQWKKEGQPRKPPWRPPDPDPWEEGDYITLSQEVVFWALLFLTGCSCLEKFSSAKWINTHLKLQIQEGGDAGAGTRNGKGQVSTGGCVFVMLCNLFVNVLLLKLDVRLWCLLLSILYVFVNYII